MRRHAVIGHSILSDSSSELLKIAAEIALAHHEKFDGTGYPRGLNGEEIPNHDSEGNPIDGRSFLLLFNAHHEPLAFTVPEGLGDAWETVIGSDAQADHPPSCSPGDQLEINSRSLLILRRG